MPEFSSDDRELLGAEQTIWNVANLLDDAAKSSHGFTKQIAKLRDDALALARELRSYNDQFESE